MRARRRVTVRLSDGQLEILRELMRVLRTDEISDAIRFCIELTGLLLGMRADSYTLALVDVLEEAVRRVAASDAGIKRRAGMEQSGESQWAGSQGMK